MSKVLIVDDDEMVSQMMGQMLGNEHDVTVIKSGKEAFALLMKDPSFDVVVSDLTMPDYSGMDLHRDVLKSLPQLAEKIVFLTGGSYSEETNEFTEHTKNLVLHKPIRASALLRAINNFLSGKDF